MIKKKQEAKLNLYGMRQVNTMPPYVIMYSEMARW